MRAAGEADPGRTVGEAAASRAAGEPAVLARPNPARLVDPPRCRCACPHRRSHAVRSPMRMPRAAGEADPGRAVGEAAAFLAAGEPAVLLRPTLAHLADPYKCRCACPHRLCHAVRSQMRTPLMQVCLCTAPILGTTSPPPPSRTLPAPANMRRGATCKLTPTFAPPACEQQQIIAVCPLAKPLIFFLPLSLSPSLPLSLSPSLPLSLSPSLPLSLSPSLPLSLSPSLPLSLSPSLPLAAGAGEH